MPTDRINSAATVDDVFGFICAALRQAQLVEDIRSAFSWSFKTGVGQTPAEQKATLEAIRAGLTQSVETARAGHQKLLRQVPPVLKWLDDRGDASSSSTASAPPAAYAAAPVAPPAATLSPDVSVAARAVMARTAKIEAAQPPNRGPNDAMHIAAGDLARICETTLESNIGDFVQKRQSVTLSDQEVSKLRILRGGRKNG